MVEASSKGSETGRNGVAGKDERGDRTGAAGDGSDCAGDAEQTFVVGVADDFVVDDIDTEVENGCARFDHLGCDKSWATGGDPDEIGASNLSGQIDGLTVANGDRGVASGEQCGKWSTDDVAATDDDRARAH